MAVGSLMIDDSERVGLTRVGETERNDASASICSEDVDDDSQHSRQIEARSQ